MVLMRRFGVLSSLVALAVLVGMFALPATTRTFAQGASITMTPSTTPQNTTVTIQLSGFRPNEIVTLWQTLPDFSVIGHGNYEVDETGSATLSWFADASYPTGTNYMSVRGNMSRRIAITPFELTLGEGLSSDLQMSVSSSIDPQGTTFRFSAVGYSSREIISIWLRTPTNQVVDLGQVYSSKEGTFDFTVLMGGQEAEGEYYLSAYGNDSQKTAIAVFELQRGDLLRNAVSSPKVTVSPRSAQQSGRITIEGESFGSSETVSVWITMPDARVVPLFEIETEEDGYFVRELQLPTILIPGTHYVTGYGKSSGLRAVTTLTVYPQEGP